MGIIIAIGFILCFGIPLVFAIIEDFLSSYMKAKYNHEEKMLELEVKRLEETNKSIQWIERQEKKND